MAKFIHAASLGGFQKAYTGWNSANADVYTSLAFTDDGYLCTHGIVFRIMRADQSFPYAVTLTGTNGTLKVDVGGASNTIQLSGAGLTAGGTASTLTLDHTKIFTSPNSNVGATGTSTITVPVISTDVYGHITALSSVTPHVDYVLQSATATNSAYNILLSGSDGTSQIYYSTIGTNPLTYNPSSGVLSTPALSVGGNTLDTIIRGSKATASSFGVVKLVDTFDTTQANNSGAANSIAASQLAIYNAYKSAIDYANSKIIAAVSFKGTLGTGGTITALPTSGYTIGDEYKVITAGTYAGNTCEVGDMIIAVKSFSGTTANSDWSVIQNNLVGAVTTGGNAIPQNALVAGAANGVVAGITVPTVDKSFLQWNGSAYTWSSYVYRPIAVDGTDRLPGNDSSKIGFTSGTNVTLSYASGTITISSAVYKIIAGLATSTANAASTNGDTNIRLLTGSTNSGTLNLIGSGHTAVTSDASGKITFNSSWRPINTYSLATTRALTALAENNLNFSTTFGLKENTTTNISEIDIAWAEVTEDASGNVSISYSV